jgi:hypothetical protein
VRAKLELGARFDGGGGGAVPERRVLGDRELAAAQKLLPTMPDDNTLTTQDL